MQIRTRSHVTLLAGFALATLVGGSLTSLASAKELTGTATTKARAGLVLGRGTVIDLTGDTPRTSSQVEAKAGDELPYGVVNTRVDGYWWAGAAQSVPGYGTACNAMYVFDRSGDATIHAALAQFIADYNALSTAVGRTCKFPILTYYRDDAHIGQCQMAAWQFAGYSFTTLCSLPIPNPLGRGRSIAWTASGMGKVSQQQNNVYIQRDFPDFNTQYTNVGHELGHAMGLNHNRFDTTSIMYPSHTVGVKSGYNGNDLVVFARFYDAHVGP